MERINIHNYQAFIVDYYEGSLTAEQQADLLLFIENHPALKDDFENYETVSVTPDNTSFPSKESLLKNITEENIDQYLVASLEGDLPPSARRELEHFLEIRPQFKNDKKLYSLTRLQPDLSVVMENQNRLKRPIPIWKMNRTSSLYYAAAASLVLLIGAYYMLNNGPSNQPLAGKTKPVNETGTLPHDTIDRYETHKTIDPDTIDPKTKTKIQGPGEHRVSVKEPNEVRTQEEPLQTANTTPVLPEYNKPENQQVTEPIAYIPDVNPELIREKLVAEINADPASFQSDRFEALLDRLTDPDSSFSPEEFIDPVFRASSASEPASVKPNKTPVLNALAWGMSKVTGDVSLEKNFNDQGELVAYRFEAGKLKFGADGNK